MKIYVVKEDSLDTDYGYEARILAYFSTERKASRYRKELFKKYCREHPEYLEDDLEIYYETDYRHYVEEIEVK